MTLIIGALIDELDLFIQQLDAMEELPTKIKSFSGFFKGQKYIVAITGIGKVNAASGLSEILNKFKIDKIINVGMAGASEEFKLGTIVPVSEVSYLDFDITHFGFELNQVPGIPTPLVTTVNYPFKTSVSLYTSDTFQTTKLPFNKPYLVDMEGAAYYHVAHIYQIPIISFKYISDYVGNINQGKQYQKSEQVTAREKINVFLNNYLKEV